jgi:hypothetical protein
MQLQLASNRIARIQAHFCRLRLCWLALVFGLLTFGQATYGDDHGPAPGELGPPNLVETSTGRAVVLYEDTNWRLVRHVNLGYLDVFYRRGSSAPWLCLDLALDWRRNTYPMAACGSHNALTIIGYDVVANVASGRRRDNLRNGVDVDQVKPDSTGFPPRLAEGLELGGIDTRFEMAALTDGFVIAGTNKIVTLLPNRQPQQWDTSAIADREIVEIAFQGQRAAAIVRPLHDDRSDGGLERLRGVYELAILDPVRCESVPIPETGVPWRLRWNGGVPSFDTAIRPEELIRVMIHDISRMPHNGAMDFGGNNLEGRVAWSQCYYINGMLSMLTGSLPRFAPEAANRLKDRVTLELRLLGELVGSTWPGLRSQRYSIGRESMTFALHAGRTRELLCRSQRLLEPDRTVAQAVTTLKGTLDVPMGCVEIAGQESEGTRRFETFRYQTGAPFWADGSNVPYNFVSGVVSGILADDPDPSSVAKCEGLMQPLIVLELGDSSRLTWRYWWGTGDAGWDRAAGISLNTPNWVGNAGQMSHISYRSMDAMAVLSLARLHPGSVREQTIAQIRDLTQRGWLLPFVQQELSLTGAAPRLSRRAALFHARASMVSQLQSHPWAIESLIASPPR